MRISYQELSQLKTFEERLKYLQLTAKVADVTFGSHRYLNQKFYKSPEWKRVRRRVIMRDDGCDLGLDEYPIKGYTYIHHLNPVTIEDILEQRPCVFDLNNLICCALYTHNLIHYGNGELPTRDPLVRTKYDTIPWKNNGGK